MRKFDFVNGQPLDVNNIDNRSEVIKRDKALNDAIENGIPFEWKQNILEVFIKVKVFIVCLQCGNDIKASRFAALGDEESNFLPVPKAKCKTCKTRYRYNPLDKVYNVKILKK